MSAIQIRRALATDAHRLSQLFRAAYSDSSHPCKDPANLRRSLEGEDRWLIALDGQRAVGCVAGLWHDWNRFFEVGRLVIHPEQRGGRLCVQLVERCYQDLYQDSACELTSAFPRSAVSVRLAHKTAPTCFVLAGHDGGANVANSVRETHLVGLTRNPRSRVVRVAPSRDSLRELAPVADAMVDALGVAAEEGRYPRTTLTGPRATHRSFIAGWQLGYRYDPRCRSRSLELTEAIAAKQSATGLAHAIHALVSTMPELLHLQLTLLADKTELRDALVESGLRVSSYLPAWHLESGLRYDCVTLAQCLDAQEPAALGTADLIDELDRSLNPLQPAQRILQRAA